MRKLLLMTILLWCLPFVSKAAIVSFSPRDKAVEQNETVEVSMWLDSELEIITAVQGEITYPKDLLQVEDIILGGSALDVWAVEPQVAEESGRIIFSGGVSEGGYVINAKIFTIFFSCIKTGEAMVDFSENPSQILSYGEEEPMPVTIAVKPSTYAIGPSNPYKINISSPTHPEEDIWYNQNNLTVQWENTEALDYSFILNKYETKEPDNTPEEKIGSKTYENLTDGIYYFGIKQKVADEDWGPITYQKFLIDTTAPDNLQVLIGQALEDLGGYYFISFLALDSGSGVSSYTVLEGKDVYKNVSSPYTIRDQNKKQEIIVRAFDKAGNETETKLQYSGQRLSYQKSVLFVAIFMTMAVAVLILYKKKKRSK